MEPTPTSPASESFRESFVLPATAPTHPPAWEPLVTGPAAGPDPLEERVRLALRVVVHLHRFTLPSDGGVAPPELTQEGVALTLSVTQGAVSKVLRRLVAADAVGHERRHVPRRNRRVRVYYLLPRGQLLAREIEERFGVMTGGVLRPQS